jgi:outer membrane protein insertion porin family
VNDEVFRRDTRSWKAAIFECAVERSKQLLQRLPYLEKVEFDSTPVPGTPDLVDVEFKIKEGLPGQFSGGVSYSETAARLPSSSCIRTSGYR